MTTDPQAETLDTEQFETPRTQPFLFMTLDPVHIGTGGYRLGRVDMSIVREPGTNLPKIPGTSLAGAARSYAAMRYGKPSAAGQHKNFKGNKVTCPIIYTFGTATDTSSELPQPEGAIQAGTVSIMDARILFFPVNSMVGPVWVSTRAILEEVWGATSIVLPKDGAGKKIQPDDQRVVTSLDDGSEKLNLGWLLFTAEKGLVVNPPDTVKLLPDRQQLPGEWTAIAKRIVLVSPKLFSQIVNSNLEVRTSVSIKPETGAAEKGALFTYEAMPRATWLWCDVIEDNYKRKGNPNYPFPVSNQYNTVTNEEKKGAAFPDGEQWHSPIDVVSAGMDLIQYLGIGGMGTRGFGRMRLVAPQKVRNGGV